MGCILDYGGKPMNIFIAPTQRECALEVYQWIKNQEYMICGLYDQNFQQKNVLYASREPSAWDFVFKNDQRREFFCKKDDGRIVDMDSIDEEFFVEWLSRYQVPRKKMFHLYNPKTMEMNMVVVQETNHNHNFPAAVLELLETRFIAFDF